jgi:hypothetical protein
MNRFIYETLIGSIDTAIDNIEGCATKRSPNQNQKMAQSLFLDPPQSQDLQPDEESDESIETHCVSKRYPDFNSDLLGKPVLTKFERKLDDLRDKITVDMYFVGTLISEARQKLDAINDALEKIYDEYRPSSSDEPHSTRAVRTLCNDSSYTIQYTFETHQHLCDAKVSLQQAISRLERI